ncbi:HNH endonuclease signature motif containing protein [Vibrio diazotrophicus]|uniref:HNH endonuclease signature motif containing protein n=1 Tax=Vibrio diazotrophicus TaxID=685 RepID=UPI0021558F80|nr:HNH endonuclease signature motif containing protein [Vibrio diazotrophicus]
MRFIYSESHLAFIEKAFKKMSVKDLTVAFNAKFNLDKTEQQIRSVIKNNKFTCGRKQGELTKGKYRDYTDEQAEFIKAGYKKWDIAELTERFNEKFEASKTFSQIRCFTRNHNVKSGRTGQFPKGNVPFNAGTKGIMKPNSGSFKKGNIPVNHKPVGSERVNVEGYIEIKILEPNVWDLKQRVVYEKEHGPIPDGHNVRFRDNNRLNCSPDNLFLVNGLENVFLNRRYKLTDQPMELKDTFILLARIDAKTKSLDA